MMLHLLPTFVAFADALSFTRAAEALHLSQPAVHVQVRKLEEAMGVPLYRRRGRGLELTPAGQEVARFGRETAERAGLLLDGLRGRAPSRPAVLAAGEGAFLSLLGPALRAFRRRGPAPLRLLTRDGAGAVEAVRSGEAHLAVAAATAVPEELIAEPLTQVGQALVVPRNHPLARRALPRLADLAGQPLVVPHPGRPHRVAVEEALRRAGIEWSVAVEANGWEPMLHFVGLGLGLAIVNASCRIPPGLAARPLRELPPVEYRLVRRRGSADHPGAAALLQDLRDHASAWRPGHGTARPRPPRRSAPAQSG